MQYNLNKEAVRGGRASRNQSEISRSSFRFLDKRVAEQEQETEKTPRADQLFTLILEMREDDAPIRVSKMQFADFGAAECISLNEAQMQKSEDV
ncbi:hypothetical protein NPIL_411771 [Nephila pilipes]|uniref:Uncharacterized protein n=1 Tax=Nephila pilipes TaxID=299642 RepID=A0A8X6MEQ2_NEPPI|nr:hypothetical protein NPIL_411771 [Nephila pilipes]